MNYFFIGKNQARRHMTRAMAAGKSENSAHTIVLTLSVTEAGSMLVFPNSSLTMFAPASASSRAMSEPETAPPSFCAMVPLEKMSPVAETPFFWVA